VTAIVLPEIDVEELRKRIPSLAEIDLPSMQQAGMRAEETIDRVLGRSKMPIWPWIAGFVVIAVIGSIAATFGWHRRSSWRTSESASQPEATKGLTPSEASLMSAPLEDL
jgi:hypothetical protein